MSRYEDFARVDLDAQRRVGGRFGGWGKGATASIMIDGDTVGSKEFAASTPIAFEAGEAFDVGAVTGTGVNDEDYQTPFTFTGEINKITIKLDPPSPPR